MARSGSDRLQTTTFDDVRRLLECVNAVRVAIPIDRPTSLAGRLLALLEASVVAIDALVDGHPQRLATAVAAPGLPKWTPVVDPVVDADDSNRPAAAAVARHGPRQEVRLLAPDTPVETFADVRPAGIRSTLRGAGLSVIHAWRPSPFEPRHQVLLQLLHPEVAWIFDGATGRGIPSSIYSVLRLMLAGKKEKEIALELGRSEHTVHAHVKRVYRHFGVNSRSQLLVRLYGLENMDPTESG